MSDSSSPHRIAAEAAARIRDRFPSTAAQIPVPGDRFGIDPRAPRGEMCSVGTTIAALLVAD